MKYSGCTTVDNRGTPWCSTKTDKDGIFLNHNFGNCGQDCPSSNATTSITITTSKPSPSGCKTQNGAACVFPFIYKGVEYSECTNVGNIVGSTPWCSTVTDEDENYIDLPINFVTWGYCQQDCLSLPSSSDLPGCSVMAGQFLGPGNDVADAKQVNSNEVSNF